jgi:histidyl-tRNA synthetase
MGPVRGTKDYLPAEQLVREQIVDILKATFKLFGYSPIETSVLESYEVAASKYGGGSEILKETYRLSDRGDRDLCLRYELTFKFAKLVANHPEIKLPFKRYEIGKVFRDGPIRAGRLREFTQCDVDVIGTKSMIADAELLAMIGTTFPKLGLDVNTQINDRKILFGIFEICGIPSDKHPEVALSLDKLEKAGSAAVSEELKAKGISEESIKKIFDIFERITALQDNNEKLSFLKSLSVNSENSLLSEGITELQELLDYYTEFNVKGDVKFTPTLARGLGYYTGPMWEVYLSTPSNITSSLAAGGRWDKMTGQLLGTEEEYPATGMTFGLDVIYAVLEERQSNTTYNPALHTVPTILLIPTDQQVITACMRISTELREAGISTDIAIDTKVGAALSNANKRNIPFISVIGDRELTSGNAIIRDMQTGSEKKVDVNNNAIDFSAILRG